MLNQVQVIGRLGKDPETRYSASGDAVCSFSVAASESYKDKSGQKQEKTEWFRCVTYKQLAEICGQYLTKGQLVYISGSLQTRQYKDKQGVDKSITEVKVRDMKMLGRNDSQPAEEPKPKANVIPEPKPMSDLEDDIPF